eukprot:816799_1
MGNQFQSTDQQDAWIQDRYQVYGKLINMGFNEKLSLNAATRHPKNINKAIEYIEKHEAQYPTQVSQTTPFKTPKQEHFIEFELPVFIKISNRENDD